LKAMGQLVEQAGKTSCSTPPPFFPAKAGIQAAFPEIVLNVSLGPRFRGDERVIGNRVLAGVR
jgi:hypothetical protein